MAYNKNWLGENTGFMFSLSHEMDKQTKYNTSSLTKCQLFLDYIQIYFLTIFKYNVIFITLVYNIVTFLRLIFKIGEVNAYE